MASFLGHFFFSARGRTGRQLYWLFGVLPLFVAGLLIGFFAAYLGMSRDALLVVLGLLVPLAAWIWVCLGARRLHDVGLSGWWMVLVLVLPFAVSFLLPERFAQLPALLAMVGLGVVPGANGTNRFGVDPSVRASTESSVPGERSNKSLERTREE